MIVRAKRTGVALLCFLTAAAVAFPLGLLVRSESRRVILEHEIQATLSEDGMLRPPGCHWELYIKRLQGQFLKDLEFRHRDPNTRMYQQIVRARKGELSVDARSRELVLRMQGVWAVPGGWLEEHVVRIPIPGGWWRSATQLRRSFRNLNVVREDGDWDPGEGP